MVMQLFLISSDHLWQNGEKKRPNQIVREREREREKMTLRNSYFDLILLSRFRSHANFCEMEQY